MTIKEIRQVNQITKAFYKMQDLCDKQADKIAAMISKLQDEIAPKTASANKNAAQYNAIYDILEALREGARIDFEDMPNDLNDIVNNE